MSEQNSHPEEPDLSKFYVIPRQELQLQNFDTRDEWILDIGGGGEGIIGLLKGRSVIAIDRIKPELEEAKNSSLKIVMDAKELMFLDAFFSYATAFFTFMYIPEDDFNQVFSEVWRILKPRGVFMIWEPLFSIPREERTKKLAVILLRILFPDGTTNETGYGGILRDQNVGTIVGPAEKSGFKVLETTVDRHYFYVRFQKP
jgi:ubiquinone/menaquinone biosynthesis C-methylase UbiE